MIRENRTYDQVLGDLEKGNGDPNLCLFGEEVTPNAHALAREFVLLDNFYVDAEVSYDGHSFSTGAYATDFMEKVWPMNYGRPRREVPERGRRRRSGTPTATSPRPRRATSGTPAKRAGVSVRSYGEFAVRYAGGARSTTTRAATRRTGDVAASVPGLEGLVQPELPALGHVRPGQPARGRLAEGVRGSSRRTATCPRLSILRLGNDHTAGTRPGYPTPRAMVAENDLALGRMVEAITKSRYWKDSAIFVLEDDAQNGPDHVDAHRSVALVVSPYTRRGAVDSTLYTTSGMLRTIELILGLPPMSQYDAAATPMYGAFQARPVLTPYTNRDGARAPRRDERRPTPRARRPRWP